MAELKISYDEHFALIIGINEYKNLSNLEYAVNDAKAIYNTLKDKFNYKEENMKLILDKKADKKNIMDDIKHLEEYAKICQVTWGKKKTEEELKTYTKEKVKRILEKDKVISILGLLDNDKLIGLYPYLSMTEMK